MSTRLYLLGLSILLLFIFSRCSRVEGNVAERSRLTKVQQEQLGAFLSQDIQANIETYTFLPKGEPRTDSIYWYLQKLYDQATFLMRSENVLQSDDRWTPNRTWPVYVFENDFLKSAFILPGGEIYFSTGLLKEIDQIYELYYVMSLEAVLMHEYFLITKLGDQFGAPNIKSLVTSNGMSSTIALENVSGALPGIIYDPEVIQAADVFCIEEICNTSNMNPTGALTLLERLDENATWVFTRPTYPGRNSILQNLVNTDCGDALDDELYQEYVLDKL